MYNKFTLAKKFLRYYITASNGRGHGIHSPFIYQFVRQVLNDDKRYYAYNRIEDVRKRLLKDHTIIEVEDRGAGSAVSKTSSKEVSQIPKDSLRTSRKISEIARSALKSPRYAQLLFRIVNFYQPARILELGTSFGITTAYMAMARPNAMITTIEGAPAVAGKALENFNRLDLVNINLVTGDFKHALRPALEQLSAVDLAFIDGNHRKDPTLQYFYEILTFSHPDTILIFDDIHWSAEMEEAWELISHHPTVTCSVDLFFLGMVFFRDEFRAPQHFTIRF